MRIDNSQNSLEECIVELLSYLGIQNTIVKIDDDRLEIISQYYNILSTNSIATCMPNIAKEWNVEKNNLITPNMVHAHSGEKFWWKCSVCGHEWEATPDHRSRGRGCPQCKKEKTSKRFTKTHLQFINDISFNSDIEILGQYSNSRSPIECRCKKCNLEFTSTPHDLLMGRTCPRCTKENNLTKLRTTNEAFLKKLESVNTEVIPLDEYVTAKTKILFRCKKCNYEWKTTPDGILHGAGCPKCAGNARITHEEFVQTMLAINPAVEIIGNYKNSSSKIEYKCKKCGYIGSMKACHLKSGHGCPHCSKKKKVPNDD